MSSGAASGRIPQGDFDLRFAAQLNERYRARISGERLMVNELYLATVYRSTTGVVTNWTSKILSRTSRDAVELDLRSALDACEKLRHTLLSSLDRYEIEPLGLYEHQGHTCSRILEFLGLLINGEWQRVPLPRAPLHEVLATSRPIFGVESIEYRPATETHLGAMLGIKEYPTPTVTGMFHALLSAPFPLGADPVLHVLEQGGRPRAAAAAIRPDAERRRSGRDAGCAAQGGARCARRAMSS